MINHATFQCDERSGYALKLRAVHGPPMHKDLLSKHTPRHLDVCIIAVQQLPTGVWSRITTFTVNLASRDYR